MKQSEKHIVCKPNITENLHLYREPRSEPKELNSIPRTVNGTERTGTEVLIWFSVPVWNQWYRELTHHYGTPSYSKLPIISEIWSQENCE